MPSVEIADLTSAVIDVSNPILDPLGVSLVTSFPTGKLTVVEEVRQILEDPNTDPVEDAHYSRGSLPSISGR